MIVVRYMHVKCINTQCPKPADAEVQVPEIAPGVVSPPAILRCATCDHDLMKVDDDA